MLPTTIRSPPSTDDYTPLSEYQSQTPESFVGGKPVLHFQLAGAKVTIPKSQCGTLAIFPFDAHAAEGGDVNGTDEETISRTVDVFVNSE
jgi:nucleotide-sensitive chloride channel 1A